MNIDFLEYPDTPTLHKKRVRILQVAYNLFLKQGIDGTTMLQIAQNAEITRRTLYNYYENKDLIAEDLQLLTLEKIHWIPRIIEVIQQNSFSAFYSLGEELLTRRFQELQYINRFDCYFSQGYSSTRYIDYLKNQYQQKIMEIHEQFPKFENENLEGIQRMITPVLIFISYLQRLVMGWNGKKFPLDQHKEELQLLVSMIIPENRA